MPVSLSGITYLACTDGVSTASLRDTNVSCRHVVLAQLAAAYGTLALKRSNDDPM